MYNATVKSPPTCVLIYEKCVFLSILLAEVKEMHLKTNCTKNNQMNEFVTDFALHADDTEMPCKWTAKVGRGIGCLTTRRAMCYTCKGLWGHAEYIMSAEYI